MVFATPIWFVRWRRVAAWCRKRASSEGSPPRDSEIIISLVILFAPAVSVEEESSFALFSFFQKMRGEEKEEESLESS